MEKNNTTIAYTLPRFGFAEITLWQYDFGVRIILNAPHIVAGMPVQWHYPGVDGVDSRPIMTDDDDALYVVVPDAALRQTGPVTGYVYIFDDTTGRTRYTINVKIQPRPSLDDDHSEDDGTYIGQLVDRAEAAAGEAAAAQQGAMEAKDQAGEYAEIAANNILNGVSTHINDLAAHPDIQSDIRRVEAIARGRATSYTFDTLAQLEAWLAGTYERPDGVVKDDLVSGDNLWIVDLSVPDYWWDGDTQTIKPLKAENPDLAEYYTKLQVNALLPIPILRADYDALYASGQIQADRFYDIIEPED